MAELFQDGWVPDEVQQREAINRGEVSDLTSILTLAEGFSDDVNTVPPVLDWNALDAVLDDLPVADSRWWEVPGAIDLFTTSQSYRPNCAGFAMANAALARTLIQVKSQFAEQKPEKFNPFPTWILSKGGTVMGGQTISKIARYGNEVGNYLASDVGEYEPGKTRFSLDGTPEENAQKHQIGICYYTGDDPVRDTLRALAAGFTAIIGQSVGVREGRQTDKNGVEVVKTGGRWSHATALAGWQNVGGEQYAFWINSHGNLYEANDGTPAFGGWMSKVELEKFFHSTFLDICFVTYCEAVHDESVKITLNPEG